MSLRFLSRLLLFSGEWGGERKIINEKKNITMIGN